MMSSRGSCSIRSANRLGKLRSGRGADRSDDRTRRLLFPADRGGAAADQAGQSRGARSFDAGANAVVALCADHRTGRLSRCRISFWGGISAPVKTPRAIVEKLNHEVNKALAVPAVEEKLQNLGVQPKPMTPDQFAKFFADDVAAMVKLGKDANIAPMD